jgi:hypothetical protein
MLSGLFFFAFAGLYLERRKLSVGETRARSLILPTGFHLFYFLEGGVSSGHFSLYFYFQDILLPVWLHIAAMEDAAPSTSPEFHFRQCLSSSILLSSPFSFHPGLLCSATLIHTPKKHIDENRDGMSAAARLPARRFWLWKTNTRRRTQ